MSSRHRRVAALIFVLLVVFIADGAPAAAHPADRLTQALFVRLAPSGADVSIAISGGILANELVLSKLDADGNGTIDSAEQRTWTSRFLDNLRVTFDGQILPLGVDDLTLTVPAAQDFHLGLSPLIVAFHVPFPATETVANHDLIVRNLYLIERTDFRVSTQTAGGATITTEPLPSRLARIDFAIDPARAGEPASAADDPAAWGKDGVIARAKRLLERPKTPALIGSLIGIFVVMGALHALQPGHGKTLVAAYLVATGGTPRDALTLAGIVTFTHTISVFALGAATLAASRFFLPSRVVPVLGVLSGLLVVAMGFVMLRNAAKRSAPLTPQSWGEHEGSSFTPQDLGAGGADHHHPHHHHHATLSEEEHARLHLAEVEQALTPGAGAGGKRRVSLRSLAALGVSGGLAPCPDALAILLLAVGINQLALGMLAIVAFSVGLAGVLVAFGLAIALVGPAWSRTGWVWTRSGRLGGAFRRVVAISPALSAAFVLLLGLAMVWRAGLGL